VCCQLLPFDSRVLHSGSREILLRKLDCPRSEPHLDRVDQLLAYYAQQLPSAHPAFASSFPSLPLHFLMHLCRAAAAGLVRGAGGGKHSAAVSQVGEYVQLQQEVEHVKERLQAAESEIARDAANAKDDAAQRLQGKRHRLQSSLQRLEKRERELQRALKKKGLPVPDASAPAAAQSASPSAAAQMVSSSPSPSAALVVQLLQVLSVLPASAAEYEAFLVSSSTSSASTVAFPAVPASSASVFAHPLTSSYVSKSFLSFSHLPLQSGCVLEREMFIKTTSKPLLYTVT
jgi:hypothetical protein